MSGLLLFTMSLLTAGSRSGIVGRVAPGSLGLHPPVMANRLHIDRTETSPEIDVDLDHGVIGFTGRSLPANSEQFYSRVYRWLDDYLKRPKAETTVNMKVDYLDTSSSKHFYNIFDRLNAVSERGHQVRVNWHYESGDEEMAETGKDYQRFFRLDFDFIEVPELF